MLITVNDEVLCAYRSNMHLYYKCALRMREMSKAGPAKCIAMVCEGEAVSVLKGVVQVNVDSYCGKCISMYVVCTFFNSLLFIVSFYK